MVKKNFSKTLGFLIFLTFDLMLLGAAVRALDAGLACPDWPLCFGQILPKYNLQVYLEVIHRYVAGVVALIFMALYISALRNTEFKKIRWVLHISLLLLFSQIIMGGLTVLKILEPKIVTLHLSLAMSFLIGLIVSQWFLKPYRKEIRPHGLYKKLSWIGLFLIFGQILLGAWVASNYAGGACMDFPTCNGQFIPTLQGPIGIQVMHRLGAYVLAVFFIYFFIHSLILASRKEISLFQKKVAGQCFLLTLSQISVGVLNLQYMVPAWLTVIHLGLALFLMITLLKSNLAQLENTTTV